MARGYAVRFCFVYFALWCAATQVLGGLLLTPFGGLPKSNSAPGRVLASIAAQHRATIAQVALAFLTRSRGKRS